MAKTFFFYDLETSGLSPREDRIMQFAGQRTDENLRPIGEPYNLLVKLCDDTLPSPDALTVTGISPQDTIRDGVTEAEFCRILMDEVFTVDTTIIGFNNIRFDDEFIRHILWRNFYDPYEWSYANGRSRWDMLDVIRMTRALRPEGIEWPVDSEGKATNRLELLTSINGISHTNAHDALADVLALIDVTKLIKFKQPKLFEYLYKLRDKNEVKKLVNLENKTPFVYVSGRYEQEYHKATVAFPLTSAPNKNVLVYDLRYDPSDFLKLSERKLADKLFATWEQRQSEDFTLIPVKVLQYNRCPAVAALNVLDVQNGWKRIGVTKELIEKHREIVLAHPDFAERLRTLYEKKRDFPASQDPEAQLYDGFVPDADKIRIAVVRNADDNALADFHPEFQDERLPELLLHYKARSFPKSLSHDEQVAWEKWRAEHLKKQLSGFEASLRRIAPKADKFMLQELQLWAESILPADD